MLDKVTPKQPEEWDYLCWIWGIEYPSTVHHFQLQKGDTYFPVLWSDVDIEKSSTERVIVDG